MIKRIHVFMTCILISAFLLSGWGFLVHRTVNQLAVYQLPKPMRPFFYENIDYLVKESVRPDQRRNSDKSEAPKHFIDAEAFGDSALWHMPHDWDQAVARYSKDTLIEYGYAPYWIMTMKERLTNAFRQNNKDSILFYAADMAHYIADAHVPLHTTINYDGQLTGQKGLHSLWESIIPEIELDQYQLYEKHKVRHLEDPGTAIWNAVRDAHALLEGLLHEERQTSHGFTDSTKYRTQVRNGRETRTYTSAFARAYSKRLGNTINQQLLKSAHLSADFWYTCWVDAGKPDLQPLLTKSQTKAEAKTQTKRMKHEWKAYKKDQLLQKNLLIARKVDQ